MSAIAPATTWRLAIGVVLALALGVFVLQVAFVRPYLWPAGTGVSLSGDTALASLSESAPPSRIRPPAITELLGRPFEVLALSQLNPIPAGLGPGARLMEIRGPGATLDVSQGLPADASAALRLWRDAYRLGTAAPVRLTFRTPTGTDITIARAPVGRADSVARGMWNREHAGSLLQMAAFLAGALVLAALGTRGMTAALMTLALIGTAVANGGPLYGAELGVPVVGPLLLFFDWIATPLTFVIIGLAVLHFPRRAPILDRHPWIPVAMSVAALPMFVISVLAAAFLVGLDAVLPALVSTVQLGWLFETSFALALTANVLIVLEGIGRYRANLDLNERRRIQMVVFTGVPAVFAYALKTGLPLVSSLMGRRIAWPWLAEAALQLIVLLPAFALPYAVAVKHVFAPRTVLRSGLQYALARRTLSLLVVLPLLALGASIVSEREKPIGDIVLAQPWFFAMSLALAAVGFRYRVQAQAWLDRRFFRAEYDAHEILVALANRVPHETDPSALVSLVLTKVDNALNPESIAVLAGEGGGLDVIAERRTTASPLPLDSGIATLLRWSDAPLEVFLDDERSPAARLPEADRAWLERGRIALIVPMLAGSATDRTLTGVMTLGPKRSEEPYSPEDRRLLSGIAGQLSVAHDLSRLRRRASTERPRRTGAPVADPTMVAATTTEFPPLLAMCPECQRCFDVGLIRAASAELQCPDDEVALQPLMGIVPVVDGKYRVDAVIGRGGMGAVFRARDLRLDRDVAVKVVRADLMADADSLARFQREAQIVARLQHPGIVTVFDYGTLPQGPAFLVMEFVAGEDLRHLLKRERTLSPARTLELMTGIAAGVDAAHRAGVLHRDLKPENVLLPASGTGPKVLDFGVAKMAVSGQAAGAAVTQGATIIGTPAYMAPEQLRGDLLDSRADVYSLTVLAYEMLTGRLPFGAGSFFDVGVRQVDAAARIDFAGVHAGIAETLRAGLSIDRDRRPATARLLVDQLRVTLSPRAT